MFPVMVLLIGPSLFNLNKSRLKCLAKLIDRTSAYLHKIPFLAFMFSLPGIKWVVTG